MTTYYDAAKVRLLVNGNPVIGFSERGEFRFSPAYALDYDGPVDVDPRWSELWIDRNATMAGLWVGDRLWPAALRDDLESGTLDLGVAG